MTSNVFVIADTHFSHKNIITYENRPFKDIYHMNETLIQNWNKAVSKNDKVFLLGDVGLGRPEDMAKYIERLNGNIVLICGNHDYKNTKRWIEAGVSEFSRYPILYKDKYLLSHRPLHLTDSSPFINVYGHVHGSSDYQTWAPRGVCVSVERHDYTPVSFDTIEQYFRFES